MRVTSSSCIDLWMCVTLTFVLCSLFFGVNICLREAYRENGSLGFSPHPPPPQPLPEQSLLYLFLLVGNYEDHLTPSLGSSPLIEHTACIPIFLSILALSLSLCVFVYLFFLEINVKMTSVLWRSQRKKGQQSHLQGTGIALCNIFV